ncbi:ATP-binding protein, partial [Herbaspirillum lusitanum]|uniref:ATP-binding protein n=1 Tax=Herbaspirillum lusitanum TaxID=213312 RepID=UPI001EE63B2E
MSQLIYRKERFMMLNQILFVLLGALLSGVPLALMLKRQKMRMRRMVDVDQVDALKRNVQLTLDEYQQNIDARQQELEAQRRDNDVRLAQTRRDTEKVVAQLSSQNSQSVARVLENCDASQETISNLLGLMRTFERWHDDMNVLITHNREMHRKNDEFALIVNQVIIVALNAGTEQVADILASVTDSLPALASELGKAAPAVAIEDNGYVIHTHASPLLKNVFMHLIRNAMDHGLETPEERQAKGKQAAGTIRLQLGVMDNMLHMALSDDGRGLALAHIRRTAVDKQLIAADAVPSDAELARLIMRAGFSTRSEVTDVSGRGVGMDAVLDFVTQEHGRIEIEFLDHAEGADFRPFQINVLLPENIAVEIDGIDVA